MNTNKEAYEDRLSKNATMLLSSVSRQKGRRLPLYSISTFFFGGLGFFLFCCSLAPEALPCDASRFSLFGAENTLPNSALAFSMSFIISSCSSLGEQCCLQLKGPTNADLWFPQSSIWHSSLQ